MASTTPVRSGTKATPQAVFAACEKLRAELGEFRNEEVLAITGGGLGTVGRLVKLYRQHEHIVAANEALDAEVTINLVQALDQLLKQQLQRSQQATDDFMADTGQEIVELAETLEQQTARNDALAHDNDTLRSRIEELEAVQAQLETSLTDNQRELTERTAQLTLKTHELQQTQVTHAAKLEQLSSQHQAALTQALEQQRQTLAEEHRQTLESLKAEHHVTLLQAQTATDQALAEKRQSERVKDDQMNALKTQLHQQGIRLAEAELALRQAKERAEDKIAGLDALVAEKQQAIEAAQRSYQQLQSSLQQQLSTNTEVVTEQLTSVSSAADSVSETLSEVSTLLQDIQQRANAIKRPDDDK